MPGPYGQWWLERVSRMEKKLHLLHILKQGMELLLLVCSFLIYYLTDCIAQVIDMPFIR